MQTREVLIVAAGAGEAAEVPVAAAPPGSRRRSWRKRAALLLGGLFFLLACGYIALTFQWRDAGRILWRANLPLLIFGGGASLMVYWFLRAVRWNILLRRVGVRVPFVDLYLCTAVALSFALFTPFQSGEMLKIEMLKRNGMMSRFPGYGSFFVERVVDLMVVLSIAVVSLLTVLNILPGTVHLPALVGMFALAFLGLFIAIWKIRLKGRAGELLDNMRACVQDVKTLLAVMVVSLFSWTSVAVSWQIFLASVSVNPGLARTMALMSVMALVCLISLIPGGLGISEAGTASILTRLGYSAPAAQAGALVLRSYSVVAIVLGLGHWTAWKVVRRRRALGMGLSSPLPVADNPR